MTTTCDRYKEKTPADPRCIHSGRDLLTCNLPSKFACEINGGKMKMSVSQLKTWNDCRFKWFLSYVRRIEQKPHYHSQPMLMGSLWDAMQEWRYTGKAVDEADKRYMSEASVAKVEAMDRAFGEAIDTDAMTCGKSPACQLRVSEIMESGNGPFTMRGYMDRSEIARNVNDRLAFSEAKFVSRPDRYRNVLDIKNQIGSYFLLSPQHHVAMMEVTRAPGLQQGKSESAEELGRRIYNDATNRPGHYFIGYNKKTRTFGKIYRRAEFGLDFLRRRIIAQVNHIKFSLAHGDETIFDQNTRSCFMGSYACEFYDVCTGGVISEEEYQVKEERD